jgi:N-acetylneuraminate lyase
MKINHLSGLIAAPFTPMKPDGSLQLDKIEPYYELLKANQVTGAFICGSTGEGVSLCSEEKMEVMQAWSNCTKQDPSFKVMTLVGGTSVKSCRKLALYAREIGLYGVSFTAPFYFKPANVKILSKTCMEVAEAVPDMPFYYYHIPVLTGVDFPMIQLLRELDGKLPNFAGIKYTHEDFMDFLSCLNFENGRYDMLWGRDENMLPAMSLGAKGAVGSTFNYAAPLYLQLMDAFNSGDLGKARQQQQISINMIELLGKYGGIATGKAYMKLIDFDCGEFRLPVRNMSPHEYDHFKQDAEKIGFYGYCSRPKEMIKT